MSNLRYVTDENGETGAVQIPIQEWERILEELQLHDSESETLEILSDSEMMQSLMRGSKQAKQRKGRHLTEVTI